MNGTLMAALISVGAVTLAEMGDKTQLLAMAFATKYQASKVLIGVFIATVLNHACAVALGNFITRYAAIDIWVQVIASLSFILFGLWTIRGDKLEGEDERETRFGPIVTVAIAFFIAELGDKTQLATIALATKFPANPIGILIGTTTGMLIADAIGIIIGVVMCKRIPERTIKLVSAGAFIFFGLIGSYQVAYNKLHLGNSTIIITLIAITLLTGIAARHIMIRDRVRGKDDSVVAEYCERKQ